MASNKKTPTELTKATSVLYSHFDLDPGFAVRDYYSCLNKGNSSGNIYLTKTFLAFVGKKRFGGSTGRIWTADDILGLESIRKNGIRIVDTTNKTFELTHFSEGSERDRALKAVERLFFGISGNSVLHTAVENLEYDKVRQIIDRDVTQLASVNRLEHTPLALACLKNDIVMVNQLMDYYKHNSDKIDINQLSTRGGHILHTACKFSLIEDQILLNLLSFDGVNVDVKNNDNTTPFHYFCEKNHSTNVVAIGKEFISRGADFNAKTSQNETPTHKAMFNSKVRVFIVNMLIEVGAKVDVRGGQRGDTPLHYAVRLQRRDLVECLLGGGADFRVKNSENKDSLTVAIEENILTSHGLKTELIVNLLEDVKNLTQILTRCGLVELTKKFISEGLSETDVLSQLDENAIKSIFPDMKLGPQMKLLKEVADLKTALREETERLDKLEQEAHAAREKSEAMTALGNKVMHNRDVSELREELDLGDGRWELSHDDLEYTAKLGSGASGQVFKGLFRGTQDVAVKVLLASDIEAELVEFKKEFQILSSIKSEYTIKFYGATIEPQLCMVMELCERGSLYDLLNKTPNISWERSLFFMRDMAEGVSVLHNFKPAPIIHRDLKSLNLLVTKDYRVKLCDFGLSRSKQGDMQTFNRLCGTFAYCAPEVFNGDKATELSDVFSMGIVIWELLNTAATHSYQMPYAEYGLSYDFQIIVQTSQGLRPSIPDGTPLPLVEFFQSMVNHEAGKRPTAKAAAKIIKNFQEEYARDPKTFVAEVYHKPKEEPKKEETTEAKKAFSGWGNKDDKKDKEKDGDKKFSGWGAKEKKDDKKEEPAPKSEFKGWGSAGKDTEDKEADKAKGSGFKGWGASVDSTESAEGASKDSDKKRSKRPANREKSESGRSRRNVKENGIVASSRKDRTRGRSSGKSEPSRRDLKKSTERK